MREGDFQHGRALRLPLPPEHGDDDADAAVHHRAVLRAIPALQQIRDYAGQCGDPCRAALVLTIDCGPLETLWHNDHQGRLRAETLGGDRHVRLNAWT
jgi:hypothetical protein